MSDMVFAAELAAVVAGLVCGALGLLVPRLVAAVPEPAPREGADVTSPVGTGADGTGPKGTGPDGTGPDGTGPDGTGAGGTGADGTGADGAGAVEAAAVEAGPDEAKPLYVDLAARPHLGALAALVSLVSGALVGAATGWDWSLVWLVPLVPVAVALSYVDWHTRLLPRLVVLPATLAAVLAMVVVGLATDERDALVRALVAMVAVRSFFWLLWFVRSAGMGFGDVRLAALVGLVLGWVGWGAVAIGVWVGFVAFAVPGLLLAVVRRDRALLKQAFPFGPFMAAGALVGLVWGPALSRLLWG